ncbi:DoxX family protein [Corynebacterium phocae]|uniref:DoxX family protein n=1 Tax=Corynebacterium phocae TaxID=161895 RepID=A0A1L7D3B8_9CORY|nr:DoxX family protein [Corynebacterium phocae]APT92600.1 DoxX family protein [Corynebacterium phocae]KAA8724155.1 DoxX family membrane protein [Corynebacterium phocae]
MIRKIARPMLASVFIYDGVDALRNTEKRVPKSADLLKTARKFVPAPYSMYIPKDTETVVKGLSGIKVASGTLFALGKAPRTSAAVMALSHLPCVIARNTVWDPKGAEPSKDEKRNGLLTNTALMGALFIVTQDTEGNPSLRWRAQKGTKRAARKVQAALPTKSESEKFAENVSERASEFSSQAQGWFHETTDKAQAYVEDNRDDWEDAGRNILDSAKHYAQEARDTVEDFIDDNRGDWEKQGKKFLKAAEKNSKVARKAVVKNAAKAQERADEALDRVKSADTRKAAKKAAKNAEKLQEQADKAMAKALKKFGDRV